MGWVFGEYWPAWVVWGILCVMGCGYLVWKSNSMSLRLVMDPELTYVLCVFVMKSCLTDCADFAE